MKSLNWEIVDNIIINALKEDVGSGDVTSLAMQVDLIAEAEIVAKQDGILAGIDVAARVFELYDNSLKIEKYCKDGDVITKGQSLLNIRGQGRSILTAERTALNIIGRMSGIATLSAEFVKKTTGTNCKIYDTRKTLPNLRILDKYAVTCGGAENHRYALYDMILIKENHIRWAGGLEKALDSAMDYANDRHLDIEIEVTDMDEYKRAATYPIKMIMLDHFSNEELREAVAHPHGDVLLEASGNVNIKTVEAIAQTGVDVISVGALTHSVSCFDFSLLFYEK